MKPSTELNILIAEKIFGFSHDLTVRRGWYDTEGRYISLKNYSEELEAAWEVVEFLRNEKKICLAIGHVWENYRKWTYIVTVSRIGAEEDIFVVADTAPHAICLAALRAMDDT